MTPISKIRYNCEFFCCTFPSHPQRSRDLWPFEEFLEECLLCTSLRKFVTCYSSGDSRLRPMVAMNAILWTSLTHSLACEWEISCEIVHFWASEKFQVACACWGGLLSGCGGVLLIVVLLVVKVRALNFYWECKKLQFLVVSGNWMTEGVKVELFN